MNRPRPQKLTTLGRGLKMIEGSRGARHFIPTSDTLRAANAAGAYWERHKSEIEAINCIGGYPDLASEGRVKKPPLESSEGYFQRHHLIRDWKIPAGIVSFEGESEHTYDNFIRGVRGGLLTPGEFTPDNPFVVSTCRIHALRTGVIATQALALEPNCLYRLPDARHSSKNARENEEMLAKLTVWAELEVGPEPGNIADTQALFECFTQLWEQRDAIPGSITLPSLPPALYTVSPTA